jgi:hypothetical protein
VTSEQACIEALREAARLLGESPSKAEYERLGLTPAASTILRQCGGWNAAKELAGLETYEQGGSSGSRVAPKPDWVELPPDETWEELSGHQRWYRKNRERQQGKKRRRRRMLRAWLYEYKREECACRRCGEQHPGCLDFHHVDEAEKTDSVAELVNQGFAKDAIRAEIDKCEVLCANCHRKEHYTPPSSSSSSEDTA